MVTVLFNQILSINLCYLKIIAKFLKVNTHATISSLSDVIMCTGQFGCSGCDFSGRIYIGELQALTHLCQFCIRSSS